MEPTCQVLSNGCHRRRPPTTWFTGAFVVAGTTAPLWADSLAQAIGYTIVVGLVGIVVVGTWSWLIVIPVTLVWAFLTRRTKRAWDIRHGIPTAQEPP